MRRLISILLIFVSSNLAATSLLSVPPKIIEIFTRKFPEAENVQWSRKRGVYTADLVYHNKIISISFEASGEVTRALCEIDFIDLPEQIRQYLKNLYSDYKTIITCEVYAIGKLSYEIEVAKGKIHYILQFNNKERFTNRFEVEKKSTDLTMIN